MRVNASAFVTRTVIMYTGSLRLTSMSRLAFRALRLYTPVSESMYSSSLSTKRMTPIMAIDSANSSMRTEGSTSWTVTPATTMMKKYIMARRLTRVSACHLENSVTIPYRR